MRRSREFLLSALLLPFAAPGAAELEATVYQDGFALFRDHRQLTVEQGENTVLWPDVSPELQPETIHLDLPPGVASRGQRFLSPRPEPRQLLERHLGREVILLREHPRTGESISRTAVLVSIAGDVPLVRVGEHVELVGPDSPWRIAFADAGGSLLPEPGLELRLDAERAGAMPFTLYYLAPGLGWQASYVARLTEDGALALTATAGIRNDSARAYRFNRLQLVAGNVSRTAEAAPMRAMMAREATADASMPERQSLEAYHLYTLPEPVALAPDSSHQLRLLEQPALPVEKIFRISGNALRQQADEQRQQVAYLLELQNPEQPAVPWPGGTVRVFTEGDENRQQFLGEDVIPHTPPGDEAELRLGDSFDLSAYRTQTLFQRSSPEVVEVGWRIRVRNAGDEAAAIEIVEAVPGAWRLLEASMEPTEREAHRLLWAFELPAGAERELTYRAETRL